MPIVCTRCGMVLQRDDSRFCNNCGAPVEAPSAKPAASQESPLPLQKPMLREQIAQQPGARPSHHALPQEAPEWMSQLDRPDYSNRRRVAPGRVETGQAADALQNPAPAQPRQAAPPRPEAIPEQQGFPLSPPQTKTARPSRELRVKIWQQDVSSSSDAPPEAEPPPISQDTSIEELPTSPLLFTAPPVQEEAIEEQTTSPLLPPPAASSEQPAPWHEPPLPVASSYNEQDEREQIEALDTVQMPSTPASRPSTPPPIPHPAPVPMRFQDVEEPAPVSAPSATTGAARRRKRGPLVLILALLLLLLLLGATGAYIWFQQPFSVPGSTEPYQSLSDNALGLSLRYPSGWSIQRNAAKSQLTLADSTHTAQVEVQVSNDGGGKLDLNRLAANAGLTNLKAGAVPATLSFAGATWQQIEGAMQQNGATYTGTLLVTTHNQRLYMLVQLAPQSVYNQEEQVSFSALRTSLHFLS